MANNEEPKREENAEAIATKEAPSELEPPDVVVPQKRKRSWSSKVNWILTIIGLVGGVVGTGVAVKTCIRQDEQAQIDQVKEINRLLNEAKDILGGIGSEPSIGTSSILVGGEIRRDKTSLELARRKVKAALTIDPDYPAALALYGQVLMEFGKTAKGLEKFRRAVKLAPDDANLHNGLGLGLLRLDRIEEAIDAFRKSMELDPTDTTSLGNLGMALVKQGKFSEAEACYRKVLEIYPDDSRTLCRIARLMLCQCKLEEAEEFSNRSKLSNGRDNNVLVNYVFGILFLAQNRIDESISAFEMVTSSGRLIPEAYNNLGVCLQAKGKLEDAIKAYESAKYIKPNWPLPYENLVGVHTQMGNSAKAKEMSKEVESLKRKKKDALMEPSWELRLGKCPLLRN